MWSTPLMFAGANHSRLTSVVYPDGFTASYQYASGLDSNISRLTRLVSGSTTLEEFQLESFRRCTLNSSRDTISNPTRQRGWSFGETTRDLYYSAAWQVIDDKVGSDWKARQVWSPVDVDALVLRDRDANNDSGNGLEERLYVAQDANWNATALVNSSGAAVGRIVYDPYGKPTFMDSAGADRMPNANSFDWAYLHQGLRLDSIVDLYDNRARAYSATLMRFLQNDPIGFAAGDANTYRYEGNGPVGFLDPIGLDYIDRVDIGNGQVHLYYVERVWFTIGFATYAPVFIGVLRPNGYVYRSDYIVHITTVERRVDKFGTPEGDREWLEWFKENNTRPPDPNSYAELARRDFGTNWDMACKVYGKQAQDAFRDTYVTGPLVIAGGSAIGAVGSMVERNGFMFSEYYHNRLWTTGRKFPGLIAGEVLLAYR